MNVTLLVTLVGGGGGWSFYSVLLKHKKTAVAVERSLNT